MRRHQRYIFRQLVGPLALVAIGLTGVIWLTQSLRFMDLIVNKGLSLSAFIFMSLLLLPTFWAVILPVALFTAILFIYNKLVVDSEMVTLRAAGLSPWSLAKPALMLAGCVSIAIYAINLYFVPNSFREFKERQFVLRSDFSSILLQEGVFNTIIDDLTVYIRARATDGTLKGILVHDSRIAGESITMMAESGALVNSDNGPVFVLINGNRQAINKDRSQLSLLYFDRYALDLSQIAQQTGERWREPRERYLHELFNPGDSEDEQRNRGKFLAEAHQRLASPLYAFALSCIALAALLGGQMNRRGQWRRILVAIVAGFAFLAIAIGLVNMIAKSPGLAPLLYLNVALTVCGSIYLMNRKVRVRRRTRNPGLANTAP